ncbi:hypothetical protein A8W25_09815 [Streptomyces sp. ERV7]|nr:hypothetical protein A8W25_09815 [Streptomyces sp. ERV7]
MSKLPEITAHECVNCGERVRGIFGRWACPHCKTNSPYTEPPQEYAAQLTNEPLRLSGDQRPHHTCGEVHCVCPRLMTPRSK